MLKFERETSLDSNQDLIKMLSYKKRLSAPITEILINRGYDTEEKLSAFLNPSFDMLHDPFLLKDMDKAVARIKKAINENERIVIYGDYDADGVTSSSLLFYVLKDHGILCDIFLPERRTDGYGLHDGCIERIIKQYNPSLIITVDCGITAVEEIENAKKLGVDVIVTDHHICPDCLPKAVACVNPKRVDQEYPFDGLAGVGVAAKLIQGLFGIEAFLPYIDIISLGTIADIVPLTDENRVFVYYGISKLKTDPILGIQALMDVAGASKETLSSTDIGFVLAPRINAGGRMATARIPLELLLSSKYEEAIQLAEHLNELNILRQTTERTITQEAIERIENNEINLLEHRFITLQSRDWDEGVIGIVASRLCEKYTRPVLLFTYQEGTNILKGSGRSIEGIDLHEILSTCTDLFEQYGGHTRAVGCSMIEDNLPLLVDRVENILSEYDSSVFIPTMNYDIEADIEWFTDDFITDLQLLEPFGYGNSMPSFLLRDIKPQQVVQLGKEKKHLRMYFPSDHRAPYQAIAFGWGNRINDFSNAPSFDFIANVKFNKWQNRNEIQFLLKAAIPTNSAKLWRNYLVKRDDVYEESFFQKVYFCSPDESVLKLTYTETVSAIRENLHESYTGTVVISTSINSTIMLLRDLSNEIQDNTIDICFHEIKKDKRCFNTLLICPDADTLQFVSDYRNIIILGIPVPGFSADIIVPDNEFINDSIIPSLREPNREIIGKIYKLLHARGLSILNTDPPRRSAIQWGIRVFEQLGLISIVNEKMVYNPQKEKVVLTDSSIYTNATNNYKQWQQYLNYLCEVDFDA